MEKERHIGDRSVGAAGEGVEADSILIVRIF